jgi:hypothetical protein
LLRGAALFNGIDSRIEVADHPRLRLGAWDFSIAVWIYADAVTGDVVGDLISNFNPRYTTRFQPWRRDQQRDDHDHAIELPQRSFRH